MAKDTKFVEALIRQIKTSIHTFGPAKVISYDEKKREAAIQPLFMTMDKEGNLEPYSVIEHVPVLGMRYKFNKGDSVSCRIGGSQTTIEIDEPIEMVPFLKDGDPVWYAIAERSIDNLSDKPFDPDDPRTHHITDAVVVGVML